MPSFERDEFRYNQRDLRDNDRRSRENEMRIDDARRELDRLERRVDPIERIAAVVNDPSITLDPQMVKIINDPAMKMDSSGRVMRQLPPGQTTITQLQRGKSPIFPPLKRTRKKTKMDKTMSRCLKIANSKLRNKNGKLKKGKSMKDVMKMAHRLCKKSS